MSLRRASYLSFSAPARYALRVLLYLGRNPREAPCRLEELASAAGVPRAYTEKLLRRLVHGGILASKRGPDGGYSLAKSPSRISLSAVLNAVESHEDRPCSLGYGKCPQARCPMHPTMDRIWNDLRGSFSRTFLAQLLKAPDAEPDLAPKA